VPIEAMQPGKRGPEPDGRLGQSMKFTSTAYSAEHRVRQARFKKSWPDLPDAARDEGLYRGKSYPFVLPRAFATHNLWEPVRKLVLAQFHAQDIAWHDGRNGRSLKESVPSPHLLDSQVCAINFWWGLSCTSVGLSTALTSVFGNVAEVVSPEPDGALVEPEWIGNRNYMGEIGTRKRGQYATSADVLIAFEDSGGRRHGVLIESKYSESYRPGESLRWSKNGRDRSEIYRPEFERADGLLETNVGIDIEDLMFDPFDQHLRQQLLAAAMERERELGFDTVTCLHVAPRANSEFHSRITAPKLEGRGETVGEVWRAILRKPERYVSIAYEDVFETISSAGDPELADWVAYQRARYGWDR
jgi:hypothetical protein